MDPADLGGAYCRQGSAKVSGESPVCWTEGRGVAVPGNRAGEPKGVGDEGGELARPTGGASHSQGKEFEFYPKCNGKPLKGLCASPWHCLI